MKSTSNHTSRSFEAHLNSLYPVFNENNYFYHKMALKGKMLKGLEHQWKQPFNYISTNLFHLEVNAELDKLELESVHELNGNIENAIQRISDNLSFYNQLFEESPKPNRFFLNTLIEKYFDIIHHKLRNNDIKLNYQNIPHNDKAFFNYENETALLLVILLDTFSDFLIKTDTKAITIDLEFEKSAPCSLACKFNYHFDLHELFQTYPLEFYMIKLLQEKTKLQLTMLSDEEQTLLRLESLC